MNIYELPKEINEALENYYACFDQETGELVGTEEEMKQTEASLFELQNRKEELLEWYLKDRANKLAHNSGIDQEILRLQELKKRNTKSIERVENIIDFNIEKKDKPTTLGNFIVSYRKSQATIIDDESKIPEEYTTRETIEVVKYPKVAISKALKEWKEVPWTHLQDNIKLTIK